mgnify:CR=1 FL=1|jgi:hypothetical protein
MRRTKLILIPIAAAGVASLFAQTSAEEQMRIANDVLNAQKELTEEEVQGFIANSDGMAKAAARSEASTIQIQLDSSSRRKDVFGADVGEPAEIESPEGASSIDARIDAAREAVKALDIVGIAPERNEFYVGAWVLHTGDTLTLVHQKEVFSFTVESVTPDAITFVEGDTQTKIQARINIIPSNNPPEMIRIPSLKP